MKIDEGTLDRIAELARLDLSDPIARTTILQDMERVISFVEKLNEVDTTGVEPLVFMTDEENVLREDIASQEITKQEALMNAPVKDSDYFKVPRVVDKGL
ncbi:MAG: Asp-tRNA(Asn)/Glu-tRNA(Gln) amidotransferase subunit GatC [Bacteroidota bacterium]|nr:Asp-tRNA(Asn)/Glu-tRNA(Gln) amidotransferase subunit GatC [Bacteroidota bacterium]